MNILCIICEPPISNVVLEDESLIFCLPRVSDFFCDLLTTSHTKGHISYYVTGKEGEDPAVFTGDTLVSLGKDFIASFCMKLFIKRTLG